MKTQIFKKKKNLRIIKIKKNFNLSKHIIKNAPKNWDILKLSETLNKYDKKVYIYNRRNVLKENIYIKFMMMFHL